ncbi:MAG: thioesterase family protein [Candidatus Binatia bacterium]|nr:thioesterase family protein [Candidatus Binatia bacterium]
MSDSVYTVEGNVYSPTKWAGSPWSTSMQHGGPVNGLFAREFERVAGEIGMQIGRITIDLFKAVPMDPLVAETRLLRQGKRVAAVETTLHPTDDSTLVSRATGLLLRAAPHDGRHWETPECAPPPPESTSPATHPGDSKIPFKMPPGFHEHLESHAGLDEAGPFVWMTTPLDLVTGETISPLQRATALTDMTLGTQMRMTVRGRAAAKPGETPPPAGALMINTDTTVYWERPFVGDDLGLRPSLITESDGIGTAEAILYDANGRVGRSLQTALVQRAFKRQPKA